MNLIMVFFDEYGTLILYTILTTIAGSCAAFVKKKYNEKINTQTKKEVVKTCVTAVQQIYKELNGEEKKQMAIDSISQMLAEKNIPITEIEISMLIESTIGEFKNVFNSTGEAVSVGDSSCVVVGA